MKTPCCSGSGLAKRGKRCICLSSTLPLDMSRSMLDCPELGEREIFWTEG
jgi:hypothetical protein